MTEADPTIEKHIWETGKYCIAGDPNKKDAMWVTFYFKNMRSPEGKHWVIEVHEIRHLSKSNSREFLCNSQSLEKINAWSGGLVFARKSVLFCLECLFERH